MLGPAKTERRGVPSTAAEPTVPPVIAERLLRFMLDKRTGNGGLNIRDGERLNPVFEDHVRAT